MPTVHPEVDTLYVYWKPHFITDITVLGGDYFSCNWRYTCVTKAEWDNMVLVAGSETQLLIDLNIQIDERDGE